MADGWLFIWVANFCFVFLVLPALGVLFVTFVGSNMFLFKPFQTDGWVSSGSPSFCFVFLVPSAFVRLVDYVFFCRLIFFSHQSLFIARLTINSFVDLTKSVLSSAFSGLFCKRYILDQYSSIFLLFYFFFILIFVTNQLLLVFLDKYFPFVLPRQRRGHPQVSPLAG